VDRLFSRERAIGRGRAVGKLGRIGKVYRFNAHKGSQCGFSPLRSEFGIEVTSGRRKDYWAVGNLGVCRLSDSIDGWLLEYRQ